MNNFIKIALIVLLIAMQFTLMPKLGIFGMWPNLILVLSLTFFFLEDEKTAFFVAALGGIICDFASPVFGLNTIFISAFLFLLKIIYKFIPEANLLVFSLIIFLAQIFYGSMSYFLKGHVPNLFLLIEGIYAVVVFFIFFFAIRKMQLKDQEIIILK